MSGHQNPSVPADRTATTGAVPELVEEHADLRDRFRGVLLGIAVGDALGLPVEGMRPEAIRRRFGRIEDFRLLGSTGFVSDDTEQAALVAESILRHPDDPNACAADFRRALVGWFWRLPWGLGAATLRACLRASVGLRPSGVKSAGNGAAMRAAVVGIFFRDRPEQRARFSQDLAEVTHVDPLAVAGATFVAHLAAEASGVVLDLGGGGVPAERESDPLWSAWTATRSRVLPPELAGALDRAATLARSHAATPAAAEALGTGGYVLCSVPFALFCFLRYGREPRAALEEAVNAGGDTDSSGAILGGWLGALHGEAGLPHELIARLNDGPFGPTHLRSLADALALRAAGERPEVPGYSAAAALGRNLFLWPVILAHALRRVLR